MRQSVGPVHIRSPISLARSVALAALLDVVSSHFFKTQNKGISLGGRETSAFKTLEQKLRISSVTRLLSFLCFQICFPIQRKSISRGFQRHLKPLGNQWLQEFDAINSLKTYKRLNLFCLQPLMGPPISAIPAHNPKFPHVWLSASSPQTEGEGAGLKAAARVSQAAATPPHTKRSQLLSALVPRKGLAQSGWPRSKSKTKVMFFHASACDTCLHYTSVPTLCKMVGLDVLKGLFPTQTTEILSSRPSPLLFVESGYPVSADIWTTSQFPKASVQRSFCLGTHYKVYY